ncbi:rod shape-determining protein MreC [Sphingomonas sp. H39-1-10]|uniref:rod shape-determining protein MreC n=1 Tax=Sphingomonas pollutisoli TaxID=3030829 RepID=UPI0023BA39E4|nr:rod shape-determining protein MreC [Sphingomonas pollutisoli]MDF0491178.1 rod shape-determining protein MreC [Sphingomonas pollutisoli]
MAPSNNRRPGFSRRAQYGVFATYVFAVAGALVGAILLALSYFDPNTFGAARTAIAEVSAPVSSALAFVGRSVGSVPAGLGSYVAVHDQNAALRKQIADERAITMRARAINYENRRLKALLALRERVGVPVTTARLVSSSAASTRRFATLNAGAWQGVEHGQPVLGPEGLIGQVLESGPNTARVLLLTDPESSVPVRRTRDGLPALAQGRGDGLVDIRSVSNAAATFSPGEVFVTSGAGGVYPPNIPVARVLRHGRDIVLAETAVRPSTLDFALVQRAYLPPPAPAPTATPTPAAKAKKP